MKYLFSHSIGPSVSCWLNYLLQKRGESHFLMGETLQRQPTKLNQFTSFLASKNQFVYDSAITTATVPSGFYVNGSYTPNGSGVIIDYQKGQVLISGDSSATVSGSYSANQINIYPTTERDEFLLFEKQNFVNPKNLPNYQRLSADEKSVPCIFVKVRAGGNEALSFEGLSATTPSVRLIIISNNSFIYDGITSLLRDSYNTYFPILSESETPFPYPGGLKTQFNYESIKNQKDANSLFYIKEVRISDFSEQVNSAIGQNIIAGFADITLEALRFSKQASWIEN